MPDSPAGLDSPAIHDSCQPRARELAASAGLQTSPERPTSGGASQPARTPHRPALSESPPASCTDGGFDECRVHLQRPALRPRPRPQPAIDRFYPHSMAWCEYRGWHGSRRSSGATGLIPPNYERRTPDEKADVVVLTNRAVLGCATLLRLGRIGQSMAHWRRSRSLLKRAHRGRCVRSTRATKSPPASVELKG